MPGEGRPIGSGAEPLPESRIYLYPGRIEEDRPLGAVEGVDPNERIAHSRSVCFGPEAGELPVDHLIRRVREDSEERIGDDQTAGPSRLDLILLPR